jgi:stage III sporulation protein SpoIIIAA
VQGRLPMAIQAIHNVWLVLEILQNGNHVRQITFIGSLTIRITKQQKENKKEIKK